MPWATANRPVCARTSPTPLRVPQYEGIRIGISFQALACEITEVGPASGMTPVAAHKALNRGPASLEWLNRTTASERKRYDERKT